MRRSKRKSTSNYALLSVHVRIESNKIPKILKASGCGLKSSTVSNLEELWHHCIEYMVPRNWYWIVPKDTDACDDVYFSRGQPWDVVLPILIDLGYITRFSNTLIINYVKFENIRHKLSGIFDLYISDNHPKGVNYLILLYWVPIG